jgi:hypothetical protein
MKLSHYISKTEAENLEKPDPDKKIISDDAFAVCDFIDQLIKKLEHARISLIR